jgi:hypothetical protein
MQKLRLFGMNGVFALMLAFTAGMARGQQRGYLILVDAENQQPFTARIGETLMQSSSHGHLLIPQLQDSSYQLIIRFPRKNIPEQVFPVIIHKKDQGFQLKGADSSWILYNWQSRETIHSVKEQDSSRLLDQGVKREDGFSRLMAAVVNDSSVMYNTYAGYGFSKDSLTGKAGLRDSTAQLTKKRKNPVVKLSDGSVTVKNERKPEADTSKAENPVLRVGTPKIEIRKLREVSLKISRKLVFLDVSTGGERDTIALFVYFEKPEAGAKKQLHEDPMVTARRLLRDDTAGIKPVLRNKIKNEPPGNELVKSSEKEKDTVKGADKILKADTARVSQKPVILCAQIANDTDVEALRSAILTRNSEQDKISVASGAFAMKCFSVIQIRQLAGLFVLDRAKYKFLDAAHLHVSDPDHFHELADMLLDKTYLKKFRTLMQKRG